MNLLSNLGDDQARPRGERAEGHSLLPALEREDLERQLQTIRRKERRHLLWMVLGISPAALVPAIGLLREGSFGLLVFLGVLVTVSQWVSFIRASREAEALEARLNDLSEAD